MEDEDEAGECAFTNFGFSLWDRGRRKCTKSRSDGRTEEYACMPLIGFPSVMIEGVEHADSNASDANRNDRNPVRETENMSERPRHHKIWTALRYITICFLIQKVKRD